ncbi:MAG: hypothetical protein AB1353_05635 [Aquificota bacterium]|nr:hypothetical protein [Aquificaceae bacterium]MDM7267207.1 hypothetical protein [Aquificaceae bacterium]QWK12920.1 MAG: hypothetical protein KNN14_08755 [Aquificota bacterium]HAV40149.1 hypothetical protein [Aquificaceae bacterium]HCO39375.1 hypothetical protein [Aquificaceae bacterium]
MSYYRELKDFILEIKGDFFLSPRDAWFLKFLEEEGYPLPVVKEGIKRFFLYYPPEKRTKLPLFMSFEEIKKKRQRAVKKTAPDWKEKFYQRLEVAKRFLGEELTYPEPKDQAQAEEILISLENEIAQRLYDALSKEEKISLMKKFSVFKENKELLKAMVKRELFKRVGLKGLSLFLD